MRAATEFNSRCPIVSHGNVGCMKYTSSCSRKKKEYTSSLRYEDVWQSHSDCDSFIRNIWSTGAGQRGLQGIVDTLASVQMSLGSWGSREFGDLSKKVKKLQS